MASTKEEEPSRPTTRRRRRISSCVLSCFGVSPVSDGSSNHVSARRRLFSWSRFRGKKKTVPVIDASLETRHDEIECHLRLPTHRNVDNTEPHATVSKNKSFICHVTSKCHASSQSAPLHQMRSSATGTRTSHPGSPDRTPKKCESMITGRFNLDAVLLVTAMVLTALLLFGRASAIICVSAWFYFLPHLREAVASNTDATKKRSKAGMGAEGRKRVVVPGLPERNVRRPGGSP